MNPCGNNCDQCQFQSPCACRGCGTPFFGSCAVFDCAKEKGLSHCGFCVDFPCKALQDCAHDPFTGDGGRRIETLMSGATL